MAKTKSKKLSRRQMVMLLGSGVVLAPAAGSAAEPPQDCHPVNPMRGVGTQQQPVLMGDPCCKNGLKVFREGYRNLPRNSPERANFKDFDAALTAAESQFMDYCVMVWGLQKNERDNLVEQMQSRYKLTPYKG